MIKTFLLSILLVSSTASASADLTGATRSQPQYAGMFIRTSPAGVMFFATFDVANTGTDVVEFSGLQEKGAIYIDENREATLQFRYRDQDEWKQEMASFQSRRSPKGRLRILPGGTGRIFVRLGEFNAVIRPEGTQYRYVVRDTKGREHVTSAFSMQDKASEMRMKWFPGEVRDDGGPALDELKR